MNYQKTNPAGVDIPINAYQVWFYGQMKTKFGITDDTSFDLYARAHNNPRDTGMIAEVLVGTEYQDVFFNDKLAIGQGFFVTGNTVNYSKGSAYAKVAMILCYTMTGITNGPYNPMHDEQVNQAIMSIVHRPRYGFIFTALVKGIDNIFKEYPAWRDTVKYSDMYPWHSLRLEFDLMYNIDAVFNCKH